MDITKFCAQPEDPRYYLHAPVNCDGKTIACNGHVIIYKESGDAEASDVPVHTRVSFEKIIVDIESFNDWQAVTDKPVLTPDECKTCSGEGKLYKTECPECEGNCFVSFTNEFNDYECDCETCNGKGVVKSKEPIVCDECGGETLFYKGIDIAGAHINPRYWMLIRDQPDLQLGYLPERNLMLFKFAEFCGGIMEMRK